MPQCIKSIKLKYRLGKGKINYWIAASMFIDSTIPHNAE